MVCAAGIAVLLHSQLITLEYRCSDSQSDHAVPTEDNNTTMFDRNIPVPGASLHRLNNAIQFIQLLQQLVWVEWELQL